MIVCEHCLQGIESHEGNQRKKKITWEDDVKIVYGNYDENGNFIEDELDGKEYVVCEWCEEMCSIDDMYEI